jgi:hypothetical protein
MFSFVSEKALYWFLLLVLLGMLTSRVGKYDFNISTPNILE